MNVRYAVVSKANTWLLFKDEREVGSFDSFDLAAEAARGFAHATAASGTSAELLLQGAFGELRSEWFAPGGSQAPGPSGRGVNGRPQPVVS